MGHFHPAGDNESSALAWFTFESLPAMLPNMTRSLDAYQQFKKTGEFQLI
jgi:hypothetical protein